MKLLWLLSDLHAPRRSWKDQPRLNLLGNQLFTSQISPLLNSYDLVLVQEDPIRVMLESLSQLQFHVHVARSLGCPHNIGDRLVG